MLFDKTNSMMWPPNSEPVTWRGSLPISQALFGDWMLEALKLHSKLCQRISGWWRKRIFVLVRCLEGSGVFFMAGFLANSCIFWFESEGKWK